MRTKKRKEVEEYTSLALKVEQYRAGVQADINPEARRIRHNLDPAINVYVFALRVELEAACTYPAERAGERFHFTIYGEDQKRFQASLQDYQA